ncbi:UNVERIFIED_CONTAM: Fstl4 [Trichonephila clavipes]
MFSHYDQNNNGQLEAEELWQAAERDHLGQLSTSCILADMLLFDDADKDGRLNINEFYLAFNKCGTDLKAFMAKPDFQGEAGPLLHKHRNFALFFKLILKLDKSRISVSVVSLDKALEVNHVTARVGDNVEVKCDVTGTPPPPIIWRRNDMDLSVLNDEEIKFCIGEANGIQSIEPLYRGSTRIFEIYNLEVGLSMFYDNQGEIFKKKMPIIISIGSNSENVSQVFVDGSLYLTNVQLVHAGNYTCHAQRNKDITQTHVLHVQKIFYSNQTLPEVHVVPKLQSRAPGELAEMECHVIGVPQPRVYWLKNDEELKMGSEKYTIIGNSTALVVGKITYSDTGAYMCVATNPAGTTRDISSLVVQDQPARSKPFSQRINSFSSKLRTHNIRLIFSNALHGVSNTFWKNSNCVDHSMTMSKKFTSQQVYHLYKH